MSQNNSLAWINTGLTAAVLLQNLLKSRTSKKEDQALSDRQLQMYHKIIEEHDETQKSLEMIKDVVNISLPTRLYGGDDVINTSPGGPIFAINDECCPLGLTSAFWLPLHWLANDPANDKRWWWHVSSESDGWAQVVVVLVDDSGNYMKNPMIKAFNTQGLKDPADNQTQLTQFIVYLPCNTMMEEYHLSRCLASSLATASDMVTWTRIIEVSPMYNVDRKASIMTKLFNSEDDAIKFSLYYGHLFDKLWNIHEVVDKILMPEYMSASEYTSYYGNLLTDTDRIIRIGVSSRLNNHDRWYFDNLLKGTRANFSGSNTGQPYPGDPTDGSDDGSSDNDSGY